MFLLLVLIKYGDSTQRTILVSTLDNQAVLSVEVEYYFHGVEKF